jgi:hypothetical protein
MTEARQEQRNKYQGSPLRAWICLRLATQDGATRDSKLVVDTACPVSFVIAPEDVPEFTFGIAKSVVSNFGHLQGEWFSLAMPEMGLNALMVGYASQEAVDAVRADQREFGGNQSEFWVRRLE